MDLEAAEHVVASLPLLAEVERIEVLAKGYSPDRKYVLWQHGQPTFLLRMSDLLAHERRQREFQVLRCHYERGTPCSQPLFYGADTQRGFCYSVLSYIPGTCAEEALPTLMPAQQYQIGLQAGRELRKMHGLPCPDLSFDWQRHQWAKYQRHAGNARDRGVVLTSLEQRAHEHVVRNAHLMHSRPSYFQHDDYHPGNLVVQEAGLAGIIDFNRCDWGDPLHDFIKVSLFACYISEPFARGQIDGYYDGRVPDTFWPMLNLYVAMQVPGCLTWAQANQPDRVKWFRQRLADMLSAHDLEGDGPPSWYRVSERMPQ